MTTNAIQATGEVRSIKGHVRLALPRAGKLRLGIKTEKGYPKEVDYFVLDQDLPGRDRIVKIYGEKPKRVLVTLVSSDPEEVFPHALKAYGKGLGLLCRGDGERALRARVGKGADGRDSIVRDQAGRPLTDERACPCDWLKTKKCRALGNLVVVLPEVGLGVYQIDTSSWWSMQNIRSDLAFLNQLLAARGGVRGMLLWLERVPKKTHGSGREETHYPLRLTLPSPTEYAERSRIVEGFIAQYQSVLGSAPALDAGPSPSALPHGSPPEADLVPPEAQVDPAEAATPGDDAGPADEDGDGADVDPDEQVGAADDPSEPEADESAMTDEQKVEIRELYEGLQHAVLRAGKGIAGKSDRASTGAYVEKEFRLDLSEFFRAASAGGVSSARAAEVSRVLRTAIERLAPSRPARAAATATPAAPAATPAPAASAAPSPEPATADDIFGGDVPPPAASPAAPSTPARRALTPDELDANLDRLRL